MGKPNNVWKITKGNVKSVQDKLVKKKFKYAKYFIKLINQTISQKFKKQFYNKIFNPLTGPIKHNMLVLISENNHLLVEIN